LLFPIAHHSSPRKFDLKDQRRTAHGMLRQTCVKVNRVRHSVSELETMELKKHLFIVSVIMRVQLESTVKMNAADL
jgi:hypothetical protein